MLALICTLKTAIAAVPAPGGSYPALVFLPEPRKPLYFAFRFDHGVPYNPIEVSSPKKGWDFSVEIRMTSSGQIMEMNNRSRAAIPISVDWLEPPKRATVLTETKLIIKARSKVIIPLKGHLDFAPFTFDIYDEAAFAPRGPH